MYEQVEKPKENKSRATANPATQKKSNRKQGFSFADNRANKQSTTGNNIIQRAALLIGRRGNLKNGGPRDLDKPGRESQLERAAIAIGSGYPMKVVTVDVAADKTRTPGATQTIMGDADQDVVGTQDHIDIFGHSHHGKPGGLSSAQITTLINDAFDFEEERWEGDTRVFSCYTSQGTIDDQGRENNDSFIMELAQNMQNYDQLRGVKAVGGAYEQGNLRPSEGGVYVLSKSNAKFRKNLDKVKKRYTNKDGDIREGALRDELKSWIINSTLNSAYGFGKFNDDDRAIANKEASTWRDLIAVINTSNNRQAHKDSAGNYDGWRVARKNQNSNNFTLKKRARLIENTAGKVDRIHAAPPAK